ncbi:hypothetical protein F5I97DRAFT_141861 [Phlebopus sp. FC_14]|nr:hypothetical protein F5I97DRAFT_141861 [Phlebopus sp. FC_14]
MNMPKGRPRFSPSPCDTGNEEIPPLRFISPSNDDWAPIVSCPADFSLDLFESALEQLIHHPEYNSTLILRAEILGDSPPANGSVLEGHRPVHNIHRRLLPRRPGRDASLEQMCTLYASTAGEYANMPSTLVLTPLVSAGGSLPYYHPAVKHLAFRYIPSTPPSQPILCIEAVILPNTPTDLNSRLYRTCLALLETLHRYGWGALTNYRKRVKHDCIVPREEYQDLYLVMRERYKHLVDEWKEVTDPLKHVFEDIGIATFLILLWKRTFGGSNACSDNDRGSESDPARWPRPPGGFLDLGCGNGLLTHILVSEGYEGHGVDLRARTSWESYPERTRAALHVHALDPTLYSDLRKRNEIPYFRHGAFLIGNHADELTPWLPVFATLKDASGYLSIPCCSWSFDQRFSRSSSTEFSNSGSVVEPEFVEGLNLGGEGSHQSQYSMYRIWLASLSQWLGWKVESDTLRIPSTRNWAIIGTSHSNSVLSRLMGRQVGND